MFYAFKNAALAGGLFSKAIAWKTGGPYSHVELVLGTDPDNRARGYRCFSSREGSGCAIETIDLHATKFLWTMVHLPLSIQAQERIEGFARAMCAAKVGYDYLGILGFGTGHGEHDDHDRFCSEVCIEALQKCAHWWPNVKRWEVSPSRLYSLTDERLIYKEHK